MSADWYQFAECRGLDPSLFFPERGELASPAKDVCAVCPVQAECLEAGMGERWGIWGGTSEPERRRMRRGRALRRTFGCGTNAGYHAHRRRGETACAACRQAHRVHKADNAARREAAS